MGWPKLNIILFSAAGRRPRNFGDFCKEFHLKNKSEDFFPEITLETGIVTGNALKSARWAAENFCENWIIFENFAI